MILYVIHNNSPAWQSETNLSCVIYLWQTVYRNLHFQPNVSMLCCPPVNYQWLCRRCLCTVTYMWQINFPKIWINIQIFQFRPCWLRYTFHIYYLYHILNGPYLTLYVNRMTTTKAVITKTWYNIPLKMSHKHKKENSLNNTSTANYGMHSQ
jgi:hypothetical protein